MCVRAVSVCVRLRVCLCVCLCLCVCVSVSVCECVSVSVCVCVYVCMCVIVLKVSSWCFNVALYICTSFVWECIANVLVFLLCSVDPPIQINCPER